MISHEHTLLLNINYSANRLYRHPLGINFYVDVQKYQYIIEKMEKVRNEKGIQRYFFNSAEIDQIRLSGQADNR